jgi:hypothetical protein
MVFTAGAPCRSTATAWPARISASLSRRTSARGRVPDGGQHPAVLLVVPLGADGDRRRPASRPARYSAGPASTRGLPGGRWSARGTLIPFSAQLLPVGPDAAAQVDVDGQGVAVVHVPDDGEVGRRGSLGHRRETRSYSASSAESDPGRSGRTRSGRSSPRPRPRGRCRCPGRTSGRRAPRRSSRRTSGPAPPGRPRSAAWPRPWSGGCAGSGCRSSLRPRPVDHHQRDDRVVGPVPVQVSRIDSCCGSMPSLGRLRSRSTCRARGPAPR